MCIRDRGYTLQLLIHPVFRTRRDARGKLEAIGATGSDGNPESFMHVEIDSETDPVRLKTLVDGLLSVLADARAAVTDWQPMLEQMSTVIKELDSPPVGLSEAEVAEGRIFLNWVKAVSYTHLDVYKRQPILLCSISCTSKR